MQGRAHFTDLDGVRGLLALTVVAGHLGLNNFAERHNLPGIIFHLSVDVFFLLSGFVLAHSAKRKFDPKQFAIKRFFRLAPVFYITTGAMLILSPPGYDWRYAPFEAFLAAPFVTNFPLNFPSWSITWELYLPILAILVPFRARVHWTSLFLGILFLGAIDVTVATGAHWYPARAALGLYCGYALYELRRRVNLPVEIAFGSVLACMFLAYAWPVVAVALPALSALLILSGASRTSIFSTALPQWFGRISYTVYLTHIPVMTAAQRVWGANIDNNAVAKAGIFLVTLVLAELLTRFVEQPAMNLAKNPRIAGLFVARAG